MNKTQQQETGKSLESKNLCMSYNCTLHGALASHNSEDCIKESFQSHIKHEWQQNPLLYNNTIRCNDSHEAAQKWTYAYGVEKTGGMVRKLSHWKTALHIFKSLGAIHMWIKKCFIYWLDIFHSLYTNFSLVFIPGWCSQSVFITPVIVVEKIHAILSDTI